MPATISLDIKSTEIARLKRKLTFELIRGPIFKAWDASVKEGAILAGTLANTKGRDTGAYARSFASFADPQHLTAKVYSRLAKARSIDLGRRPGKAPPAGALLPWMERHGIPASAEFAIRRSIGGPGGTRGKFVMRKVKAKLIRVIIPRFMALAREEILMKWLAK